MSIVSHGHCELAARLVRQLCEAHTGLIAHVVLTHNVPSAPAEAPTGGWPFLFTELFNDRPLGFGTNHNRAFAHCGTEFFCILNPDIELPNAAVWQRLVDSARQPGVACAYPTLFNGDGSRQENARELVTPAALLRRHVLRRPQRTVDWASAAFWLVRSQAWRQLGGFDERYFMYCEDVDFCVRLQLSGWRLAHAPTSAVHEASWASRHVGRHQLWHLRSMLRLWLQPHFAAYLRHLRAERLRLAR